MIKLIFKISIPLFFLIVLQGCNSITKLSDSLGHHDMCLSTPVLDDGVFYANGSAASLEQAKSNARQDLVLQISSEVSSSVENTTTDNNGKVSHQSSSAMRAKSASIPVDQHKITQTCKSGDTYYVAITLEKSQLIKATQQRLKRATQKSQKLIKKAKRASRYEMYIARQKMQKQLEAINTYTQILLQYTNKPMGNSTRKLIARLENLIEKSDRLVIGVRTDSKLRPLQGVLEQALNKSALEYKQGAKDTVAVIKLKSRHNNQRSGKRYIVKLNASLEVSRGDTGQLLSSHEVGQAVGTSTVSYDFALQLAQKKLHKHLKRYLSGDANKIRNILGLSGNEK